MIATYIFRVSNASVEAEALTILTRPQGFLLDEKKLGSYSK